LASSFNKALILLDYELNRNYIANTLCENKDKLNSCCKGKCFIKKKMAKEDSQEKSGMSKEKFETTLFLEDPSFGPMLNQSKKITYRQFTISISNQYLSAVFHPPGIIPA